MSRPVPPLPAAGAVVQVTARDQAFVALEQARDRLGAARVEDLVAREPMRRERMAHRLGPLQVDLTRQRIDLAALDSLLALAEACELRGAIADLFAGEPVNRSEGRPALHMALRAPTPLPGDDGVYAQAVRLAEVTTSQVERLVDEVRGGEVTDLVHVGIGGSDLGPRLACEALAHEARGGPRVHFVANVDGTRVDRLVRSLDPRTTQVTLVSKSFATQETLLNARVLREFVGAEAFARRTVAVTAKPDAARAFGVDPARILPMWDWVGGRYSLWSAVGFPLAAMCGNDVLRRLRAGAHALDAHYASAPFERNLPVLLAIAGIWNRNVLGYPTLGVIAYDDRLEQLPSFLQQLDMESNGKRVDEHGAPLARPAAPVIWGQVGTNAQHAFFQSLHQGVDTVPLDLVGVVRPSHALRASHDALLANFVAQSAAFLLGTRAEDETDSAQRAQKASPGDRPHNVVLLDELTPEALGMLLALYEHKVHAQGRLWGVNSFDQWGVELGKKIVQRLQPAIEGGALPEGVDAATAALVREIRSRAG